MSGPYNSTDCDTCSEDEDDTQTLFSRIIDTEQECVMHSNEEATHEIEFVTCMRHSVEGELVATSTTGCIKYIRADDNAEISDDRSSVSKQLRVDPEIPVPPMRYEIKACSTHTSEDYLKTSLNPPTQTDADTATVSDGGNPKPVADLELVPKVNIKE